MQRTKERKRGRETERDGKQEQKRNNNKKSSSCLATTISRCWQAAFYHLTGSHQRWSFNRMHSHEEIGFSSSIFTYSLLENERAIFSSFFLLFPHNNNASSSLSFLQDCMLPLMWCLCVWSEVNRVCASDRCLFLSIKLAALSTSVSVNFQIRILCI